jgi:hypothetical protein
MAGRPPKPEALRHQRNRLGQLAATRLAGAGPSGVAAPPMPRKNRRGPWTTDAKRAWLEWWASPMALAWIEADKVALYRALRLVDDIAAGRSDQHAALTALEDRLGLTPKARRALSWEIDRAHAAAGLPTPPATTDPRLKAA